MTDQAFLRCNLYQLRQEPVRAHDGEGEVWFTRVATAAGLRGACNFIDFTTVPPGASIGEHSHAADQEEFYLVLAGSGRMLCGGESFDVTAGDLVRNPPGGTHALRNTGAGPLRLFVFELQVRG
ncbi:MAG TPA: cupin domain-containing protein [Longimicrobium sp.]|nr:cupin domain-containing protein [Longimicrobium sp.]